MRGVEQRRITLGFPPNEPLGQRQIKDIRETRNRKRERQRKHKAGSLARQEDIANCVRFQLERATEHVLERRATRIEIDYVSKHGDVGTFVDPGALRLARNNASVNS